MNENDKQELLQQLDKCKAALDCQSCYKGAISTIDMIISMVKEKM